jgi:hypothetical protein
MLARFRPFGSDHSQGFVMIEVVVSIFIAAVLTTTAAVLTSRAARFSRAHMQELTATLHARELMEIAKAVEGSNWSAFAACQQPASCYPQAVAGRWTLVSGEESVDGFRRSLTVLPVWRNQAGFPNSVVPADAGGVLDADTRQVQVTVSWEHATVPRQLQLATYIYKFPLQP